jgi:hypothetical protein
LIDFLNWMQLTQLPPSAIAVHETLLVSCPCVLTGVRLTAPAAAPTSDVRLSAAFACHEHLITINVLFK